MYAIGFPNGYSGQYPNWRRRKQGSNNGCSALSQSESVNLLQHQEIIRTNMAEKYREARNRSNFEVETDENITVQ